MTFLLAALLLSFHPGPTTSYCCAPAHNPYVLQARRAQAAAILQRRRHHGLPWGLLRLSYFVRLTVYTGNDPSQGTGAYTASGQRLRYGLCAVDPSIFPLGTYLYIPGYGVALAADTGGGVFGHHIDLAFGLGGTGSAAYRAAMQWSTTHAPWGRVYVIPKGLLPLFR